MTFRISKLTSTIRLYGQCPHPKRINGRFTIELGDTKVESVEVVEGHVNRMGPPQRLISFIDLSANWSMSKKIKTTVPAAIGISNDADRLYFSIERTVVEVVGTSDEQSTERQVRGRVSVAGDVDGVLDVYEVESNGIRQFFFDAPLEVLAKVQDCIREKGMCVLAEMT